MDEATSEVPGDPGAMPSVICFTDDDSYEVRWSHDGWPLRFFFAVVDQRIECVGLQVGTQTPITYGNRNDLPPLDHSAVRFPISRYIDTAREAVISYNERELVATAEDHLPWLSILRFGEPAATATAEHWAAEDRARAERMLRFAPGGSGRRGRPPLSTDFLEEVARFYNLRSSGRTPTKDVADEWQVSHTAAAKWVFKARKAGLLPPARKAKP